MRPTFFRNLGLALLMALGSLGQVGLVQPAHAEGVWFVAPGGDDLADCASPNTPCATINGAIAKAGLYSSGTIRVAAGTYTHTAGDYVVTVGQSMNLSGGWDPAFTAQTGWAIIDGQEAYPCLYTGWGTLTKITVDRFIIQHGRHSYGGGGITNETVLILTNSLVQCQGS